MSNGQGDAEYGDGYEREAPSVCVPAGTTYRRWACRCHDGLSISSPRRKWSPGPACACAGRRGDPLREGDVLALERADCKRASCDRAQLIPNCLAMPEPLPYWYPSGGGRRLGVHAEKGRACKPSADTGSKGRMVDLVRIEGRGQGLKRGYVPLFITAARRDRARIMEEASVPCPSLQRNLWEVGQIRAN